MGWISRDYYCKGCGHEWDDLVQRSEENDQKCPECQGPASIGISCPNVASFSLLSKDDQAKSLRKRSRDHTRKELKKDPTQARMTKRLKMKGSR